MNQQTSIHTPGTPQVLNPHLQEPRRLETHHFMPLRMFLASLRASISSERAFWRNSKLFKRKSQLLCRSPASSCRPKSSVTVPFKSVFAITKSDSALALASVMSERDWVALMMNLLESFMKFSYAACASSSDAMASFSMVLESCSTSSNMARTLFPPAFSSYFLNLAGPLPGSVEVADVCV